MKVFVGPEHNLWILNEDLLCDRVTSFKGAFCGSFKEGLQKTIELPEDCPIAFANVVEYIYTKTIAWPFNCLEVEQLSDDQQLFLCRLWVLADKLGIHGLCEQIETCIEARFDIKHDILGIEAMIYIYNATIVKSGLRKSALVIAMKDFLRHREPRSVEEAYNWAERVPMFYADMLKNVAAHIHDNTKDCIIPWCVIHEPRLPGW